MIWNRLNISTCEQVGQLFKLCISLTLLASWVGRCVVGWWAVICRPGATARVIWAQLFPSILLLLPLIWRSRDNRCVRTGGTHFIKLRQRKRWSTLYVDYVGRVKYLFFTTIDQFLNYPRLKKYWKGFPICLNKTFNELLYQTSENCFAYTQLYDFFIGKWIMVLNYVRWRKPQIRGSYCIKKVLVSQMR